MHNEMPETDAEAVPKVAYVLGGGGDLGANEVGMLRALLERGILPDLIVGTSIGAMNGAAIAAEPTLEMLDRLEDVWRRLGKERVFDSPFRIASTLIRERTHLNSNLPLRRMIHRLLPVTTFEELAVPFQCVAACIERAAEHWFTEGCLADAIVASSAVPGLLPVVEIGGEHFMDGGIVLEERAADHGIEHAARRLVADAMMEIAARTDVLKCREIAALVMDARQSIADELLRDVGQTISVSLCTLLRRE